MGLNMLNKKYLKYIVNFKHAKCFDMGIVGRIVIELDNEEFVTVSRRRIRDVMEYLNERSI